MLPSHVLPNKLAAASMTRPVVRHADRASPLRFPKLGRKFPSGASVNGVRRTVSPLRAAVLSESLADVGGGGGNRGNVGFRQTAEDGGGNFFEHNALIDVLVKGGVALSELPHDLQEALSMGLLSMKDVHMWIDISGIPLLGGICRAAPAVRDRVMGNPRFAMQLVVELALGLSARTAAEIDARGEKCFKEELPLYLSDLALEACADIALVWLLSPKRCFRAPPSNRFARGIASLPGHSLQSGAAYSLSQRAMTVLYRGFQFLLVGFGTSAIGHSFTKFMVERQPGAKEKVKMAPVLDNSLGFGAFMAVSSNLRYQTVNGLEERIFDAFLPSGAPNLLATLFLRFANSYLGGVQWMAFAKQVGLQ